MTVRAADVGPGLVVRHTLGAYTVEIDGEAVILDETHDRLHHLNPTAALVWSCLDGIGTIAQIATDLAHAFDAPHDDVVEEVVRLVRDLAAEGLLDCVAP